MPIRKRQQDAINVVIAGGGVAALETALAVRELAGDRARLTLLAPNDEFSYRPVGLFEPFLPRPVRPKYLSLVEFANDVDATLTRDGLASVDCDRRTLQTVSESELPYDALVIAIGASAVDVLPAALTMSPNTLGESLRELIRDIDSGTVRSLGVVVPSTTAWPLPAYEFALLAQERAHEMDVGLQVSIITAEVAPLAVFGSTASAAVAEALSAAGITTLTGVGAEMLRAGEVVVRPSERHLSFDRVVAVPQLVGPAVDGLPSDPGGFLPVTSHARVLGVEHVYAAGDATDFPVKQGGVSAGQADAAAESIAAWCGATVDPSPFDPLVRGMLLLSRKGRYLYLSARVDGGAVRDSQASETPTWSPPGKIAAHYLGPYLDQRWGVEPPGDSNWHAWSFLRLFETNPRE